MQGAAVATKGLRGGCLEATLSSFSEGTGSSPIRTNAVPCHSRSNQSSRYSRFQALVLCRYRKSLLKRGGRQQRRGMMPTRAAGNESNNGAVSTDSQKQSQSSRPQDSTEGGKKLGSGGGGAEKSAEQNAALQALDAQLNRLSKKDSGQINPRRKFAEDLARKTGRPVPSESPPSKRTLAGDYLDKSAWNQDMVVSEAGFDLDATFLAYTAGLLFVVTIITNLVLNKYFPLPTKAQIKEMRTVDEARVFPNRVNNQREDMPSAPPLGAQ